MMAGPLSPHRDKGWLAVIPFRVRYWPAGQEILLKVELRFGGVFLLSA